MALVSESECVSLVLGSGLKCLFYWLGFQSQGASLSVAMVTGSEIVSLAGTFTLHIKSQKIKMHFKTFSLDLLCVFYL